jgi:hypothetical protein
MTVRRGYSDSKLTQILKPKLDEENLNNFLPKFLLKDISNKDQAKVQKEIPENVENEKIKNFFESFEDDDTHDCLNQLSIKDIKEVSSFLNIRISIITITRTLIIQIN